MNLSWMVFWLRSTPKLVHPLFSGTPTGVFLPTNGRVLSTVSRASVWGCFFGKRGEKAHHAVSSKHSSFTRSTKPNEKNTCRYPRATLRSRERIAPRAKATEAEGQLECFGLSAHLVNDGEVRRQMLLHVRSDTERHDTDCKHKHQHRHATGSPLPPLCRYAGALSMLNVEIWYMKCASRPIEASTAGVRGTAQGM